MKTLVAFIAEISLIDLLCKFSILLILVGCNHIDHKHNSESFLREFMQEKYEVDWKKIEYLSPEVMPFIYDKDNPPTLKYIRSSLLEVKIGYKFYLTSLRTSNSEYPELEVIFAVDTINWTEPMMLPSPVLQIRQKNLFRYFMGLKALQRKNNLKSLRKLPNFLK